MTRSKLPVVLVVDQAASFVAELDEGLSGDYAVLTALDAIEGYALACQFQPNALVLDVTLPIVDGWTLLRKLRSNRAVSEVPVIIVTRLTGDAVEQQAAEFGVLTVLRKPCTVRQVRAALKAAVHT